jgi:hypothetical protein
MTKFETNAFSHTENYPLTQSSFGTALKSLLMKFCQKFLIPKEFPSS